MKTEIVLIIASLLVLGILASGCVSPIGSGTLVMYITDQPSLVIDNVVIAISDIEVHRASEGNESGWTTVVGAANVDLVAIRDVQEFLGEKKLEEGTYNQIRLNVDSAKLTTKGTEYDMEIPSRTVKLVKAFEIRAGEATNIILDFDALESVHEAEGKYIMRPTIKVIGPSPGERTKEQGCTESGGTVALSTCCLQTEDFPNTCLIGACGCSAENSHEVNVCHCGEGKCFDGNECVAVSE